jgi:hypothetical protein
MEDLDLPRHCHAGFNKIHPGAAQWNSARTTLITGSGTFSGVGCAWSNDNTRWELAKLALAITLNENLGATPINLSWAGLHEAHVNNNDLDCEASIDIEIADRRRTKQLNTAASAAAPAPTVSERTPVERSYESTAPAQTQRRKEGSPGIALYTGSSPGTSTSYNKLLASRGVKILRVRKTIRISAC